MDHAMQQDWRPRSDDEMAAALNKSLDALPLLKDKDKLINRAQFFAALGDETRLKIIGILRVHDCCLCELVAGLNIPSSTLKHHLQFLERGGVVRSRKEKKYTIFSLAPDQNLDAYL
ncbi:MULTISPECIES: ArsR/SmtB family transcription factor [Paenibacillus]|uniref:ArsR/SmtB family transcription factor n=1 Tax=Paenibacillus TaxID=44249 RepID=UPI0029024659|nr:metalloregulator ArsR/SmtB family transcription factor [Paenibacillus sp.]MDU2239901.1 metalloregulator ArsR/SmtB family transcription factor [Paenibacillus sp.]